MWWSKGILLLLVAIIRVNGEEEEEEEDPPQPPPPPFKPLPDLAKDYGYEVETFPVHSNGYILDIFHIKPKSPGGPVVFIQHGLMASADCWTIRNFSLAYALTDAGNDVWLGNIRGTVYGRKHEKLNPDTDEAFWKYNIGDMGLQDIPAMIDFVLEKTKAPQIYYIGHSMGTTMFIMLMSTKPEYNDKIKEAILLAPSHYSHKYQFMLVKDSSMYQMAVDTLKQFDDNKKWEAFPRSDVPKNSHQLQCGDLPEIGVSYCNMAFDMGKPFVGEYLPAGQAVNVLKHYMQVYTEGVARPYDFGEEENMKLYKQKTPPDYNLKNIKAKVNIFYAKSDQLVDVPDAEALSKDLPNVGISEPISAESFNHFDFVLPTSQEAEGSFNELTTKIKGIIKK